MDMMSMISSILAAQAGNAQMQIATSILKSNADAEKSAVQTLLGVPAASSPGQSWPRHRGPAGRLGLNQNAAAAGLIAAAISLIASSLAHSAGPAMVAISQPLPSTSTEVGMPRARPTLLRSWKTLAFWSLK